MIFSRFVEDTYELTIILTNKCKALFTAPALVSFAKTILKVVENISSRGDEDDHDVSRYMSSQILITISCSIFIHISFGTTF